MRFDFRRRSILSAELSACECGLGNSPLIDKPGRPEQFEVIGVDVRFAGSNFQLFEFQSADVPAGFEFPDLLLQFLFESFHVLAQRRDFFSGPADIVLLL